MKTLIQWCVGLAIALNTGTAYGFSTISGNEIMPSTDLSTACVSWKCFSVDQMVDGITMDSYPYNGFSSYSNQGTITLDLVRDYELRSFILWNDINVYREGIKNFHLDFFNRSDELIPVNFSTTFAATVGQVEPTEYIFDELIPDVSRVNLVVLDSHVSGVERIEIREVAFTGTPTTSPIPPKSVPEPSSVLGVLALGALGVGSLRQRKQR